MAYWAVSGKCISLSNQTHAKQKQTCTLSLFQPVYLAVICRRTLGWDSVLNTEAEQGPVSPLLAYSASGYYSRHLRGKCHKMHKTHKLCLNFFALLSPTTVLLIWKSFLHNFMHQGCMSFLLLNHQHQGEKWAGEIGYYPCACPKIDFISKTPWTLSKL